MQRIVTLTLVVTVLPTTAVIVGRAQGGGTPPVSTARAANAPPLVPVRLNADGNFRIAPPYVADPAFTAKPDVPQGRVIRFTMNSAESKIFPTAPAGRGGRQGGAPRRNSPASPCRAAATSDVSTPGRRLRSCRIRAQYPGSLHRGAGRTLCTFPEDPPAAADGQPPSRSCP